MDEQIQRYLIEEEIEEYREGRLSRHEFLRRISVMTGGAALSGAIAGLLSAGGVSAAEVEAARGAPRPPEARADGKAQAGGDPELSVPADSPEVETQVVRFEGPASELIGYLAKPAGVEQAPGVLVIHENRGLDAHIQDVTRRVARAGFVGLCVDLVSRAGGTTEFTTDEARAHLMQLPPEDAVADLTAGVEYLLGRDEVSGEQVGVVGFCYGGAMSWRMAASGAPVACAVVYYGVTPEDLNFEAVQGPVMGNYGEMDERVNATIPRAEQGAEEAGFTFLPRIYEGVGHAFNNDTRDNYNPDVARAAWARTIDFFEEQLGA